MNVPVSYTHLDVYKRQVYVCACVCIFLLYIILAVGARGVVDGWRGVVGVIRLAW